MATRKSSRLNAKAETAAIATTKSVQKEKLTTEKARGSQSSKKRKISNEKEVSSDNAVAVKSSRASTKRKREDSKFLKEIPLDVLLEIFKLLEPIDLLHLSRVSSSLHDLLTSDDTTSLWKSTYANIAYALQPPRCPNDANVVFYTNYLYGRHCQFCASANARVYHESAFIRLCSKCVGKSLFSSRRHGVDQVFKLCNSWSPTRYKSDGHMILKVEYNLRSKELGDAQRARKSKIYLKERDTAIRNRLTFAFRRLEMWRRRMHQIQRRERKVIMDRRRIAIKKKLVEEGFGDDFYKIAYRFDRIPHVRKFRELTDSEWGSIRVDIMNFFQGVRDEYALADMQRVLRNRIAQLGEILSQWKIHPTAWWIASSKPVASFVKETSKDVKEVESQLPDLITSWKEETERFLITLIPRPSGKGKKKENTLLELATSFFKCHWCTEPISYPRILMHDCFLRVNDVEQKAGNEEEEEEEEEAEDSEDDEVLDASGQREPRPPRQITPDMVLSTLSGVYSLGMYAGNVGVTFDEEASNVARDIITVCGEDPNTVTHREMEEADVRLECLRCSLAMQTKQRAKSSRLVMKWIMALVHELEEHYGEEHSNSAWRKIDSSEDLAQVEKAEIKTMKLKKYQNIGSVYRIYPREQHGNEVTFSPHFSPDLDASIKLTHPAVKL